MKTLRELAQEIIRDNLGSSFLHLPEEVHELPIDEEIELWHIVSEEMLRCNTCDWYCAADEVTLQDGEYICDDCRES